MRPSGLGRRYSSFARKLRACNDKNESHQCIKKLIRVQKDALPAYKYFEEDFLKLRYTSEVTKDKKVVQYILRKIEFNYMKTDELQPLSFTIEHILPESTQNKNCGLVGNLLPLGEKLNNELQDKEFKKKMQRYSESSYKSVKHFIADHQGSDWTEENIIERTKALAKLL